MIKKGDRDGQIFYYHILTGPVAQSVTSLIADPGVMSLIQARSHTFVEIDHEKIFSMVILILPLIQEGLLSVTSDVERSGSVVECLIRDRRAVGSSLTGVTALCP